MTIHEAQHPSGVLAGLRDYIVTVEERLRDLGDLAAIEDRLKSQSKRIENVANRATDIERRLDRIDRIECRIDTIEGRIAIHDDRFAEAAQAAE